MAAPKAQDMSVRDEDTLAQDQSLDRLQASMKKTLGFDGGPTGLVHMDTSELHQFMGELGEKMAQHLIRFGPKKLALNFQPQAKVISSRFRSS